ncbi:MAG: TlpA family protein disulfide reductase [Gemmatimonadota bacterium]
MITSAEGLPGRSLLLSCLVAAGMGACGGERPQEGPRPGAPLPAYAATTLDGDSVALASFRGRPVLLNLWATWCAPCRHETPFLQSLYEQHRDQGFVIVGVSMDTADQAEAVREFIQEFGVTYPILHDRRMVGMDTFRVLGLPASFLIDREGILRWMRYGPVSENDEEFLTALEDVLQ